MDTRQDEATASQQRKLPRQHYSILAQMAANPSNPLRKLSGGFWVVAPDVDEYQAGEWHAGTSAVSAMLKNGLVRYAAGREAVELTPVGLEALKTELYIPLE